MNILSRLENIVNHSLFNKLIILLIFLLFLGLGIYQITHSFIPFDHQLIPHDGDSHTYYQQAKQVIRGSFTAVHSKPGLVYFEALLLKIFGYDNPNIFSIFRIANVILGALTAVFIYFIANLIFKKRIISLTTIAILAIWRAPLYEAERLLTEPLFTFLATLSIFFVIRSFKYYLLRDKILAGIFLGMALMTRGEIKFFIPLIFIWAFIINIDTQFLIKNLKSFNLINILRGIILPPGWGKTLFCFLTILAFMFLAISPLTFRNYQVSGQFILINTDSGGEALWLGNLINPAARSYTGLNGPPLLAAIERSDVLKEQWTIAHDQLGGYTTQAGSDAFFKFALENIKNHPKDFLTSCLIKSRIIWTPGIAGRHGSVTGPQPGAYFLVGLIFLGMYLSLFMRPNRWSWLLLFYIWSFVLIHIVSRTREGRDLTPFISLAVIFGLWAIYLLIIYFWNFTKKFSQNRGLLEIKIGPKEWWRLIIVFFTIIIIGGGLYWGREIISIAYDETAPSAYAIVEKIDSNIVKIAGVTDPGALVILEDNGKALKENIKVDSKGRYYDLFLLTSGQHDLTLKYFNKSYQGCRGLKQTVIIPEEEINERQLLTSPQIFCLNGNISEKEKEVILGATYTYSDGKEEFFPNAVPDQGGTEGWLATGGEGPGFGDLTDSRNSTYDNDGRVAFILSPARSQMNVIFDLKRNYFITDLTIMQHAVSEMYGFHKVIIQTNQDGKDWQTISMRENTEDSNIVEIKELNSQGRFVKTILVYSPPSDASEILFDLKIFGKKILLD